MAEGTDASSTSPHHPSPPDPFDSILKSLSTLRETNPWIQSALDQAQIGQQSILETADSAIATTRSRLTQIGQTASAHSQQTLELVKGLKDDFDEYEARAFGKIKEGILAAPVATGAVAAGLGLLLLKGPRRFLYYKTLRLFQSPEASLAKADNEFKELRQTFERLKAESDMLEKKASVGEQELIRGRTKLRQAGTLIHKALYSADKIEKRASGLKDALLELPRSDAVRFRTQVSNLVAEVKQEKRVLSKEVSKISNYGISV
ncbi:hypothetical protein Droror1_Dr00005046 [Drosera rotundifolia]